MPTYQYEAMDNTGLEIKETIDAASEAEAQQKIKEKGFFVTKIQEKGRSTKTKGKTQAEQKKKQQGRKKTTFAIGGVRPKQLCTFTRQLSTLQDAGLPILRSLRILEGQSKPGPLKNSLIGVIEDIESGSTLSEAMGKQPKAFDNLYVNMVKAGEAGGALEIILQRLAEFKERSQSLKRKVQGAMIYPVAVITVATGIVGFIMYWIIPKFKKIFQDFGIELPGITIALIAVSDWVVDYFYLIPAIPVCFWLMAKIIQQEQDRRVRPRLDLAQGPDPRQDHRKIGRRPLLPNVGHTDFVRRADFGSVDYRPRHGGERRLPPGLRQHLCGHSRRRIDGRSAERGPHRRRPGCQHGRRRRGNGCSRYDALQNCRRLRRGSFSPRRRFDQSVGTNHGRDPRPDCGIHRHCPVHAADQAAE